MDIVDAELIHYNVESIWTWSIGTTFYYVDDSTNVLSCCFLLTIFSQNQGGWTPLSYMGPGGKDGNWQYHVLRFVKLVW
jgi:hypothetical protein